MNLNISENLLSSKRLVVTHWYCFHLPSRIHLLEDFLAQKCPEIVLLNEININQNEINFYFNFKNYNAIVRGRNINGVGVSILVKEGLGFKQDFNAELLCIKKRMKNKELFVFSIYNPPNIIVPFELFSDISKRCEKFILGGDLNPKAKSLGFSERTKMISY